MSLDKLDYAPQAPMNQHTMEFIRYWEKQETLPPPILTLKKADDNK